MDTGQHRPGLVRSVQALLFLPTGTGASCETACVSYPCPQVLNMLEGGFKPEVQSALSPGKQAVKVMSHHTHLPPRPLCSVLLLVTGKQGFTL